MALADAQPRVTVEALAAPGAPVLVISPHPDDETLGCGAAIAAALASGRDVWIALLTAGTASHPRSEVLPPDGMGALRLLEFARACARLAEDRRAGTPRLRGLLNSRFLGFEDTKVPRDAAELSEAVDQLAALATATEAGTLWSPWIGDPHRDHEAAAVLGALLARELATRGRPLEHRAYAVWGRFGPLPGGSSPLVWPFDCHDGRSAKKAAMAEYRSQLTPLVPDDPEGFVMPPRLVAHFAEAPEIFLDPSVRA
jgi:LmbE family N-acetylglucosaminyl deacetylase